MQTEYSYIYIFLPEIRPYYSFVSYEFKLFSLSTPQLIIK